jgi:hypothetical protein
MYQFISIPRIKALMDLPFFCSLKFFSTTQLKGRRLSEMEHASLTAATWFWLLVPQLLVVAISVVNVLIERRKQP